MKEVKNSKLPGKWDRVSTAENHGKGTLQREDDLTYEIGAKAQKMC